MRLMTAATSVIATTICAVTVASTESVVATAGATSCPQAMVIAVPGTTETTPDANPLLPRGLLTKVLEPVKTAARPIRVGGLYVPYPASIIEPNNSTVNYSLSRRRGIDNTTKALVEQSSRCPNTRFLLTGYSQGAHVAGDTAALIGAGKSPIAPDRILGVALLADPAQAPQGAPTLGLTRPATGLAGARQEGFGALSDRVIAICAPSDFYCNAPVASPTIRLIGLLGSQIDPADPAASARQLLAIITASFLAPVTTAINGFTALLTAPDFVANLMTGGQRFLAALIAQSGMAGPVLAGVGTVINAVHAIITAVSAGAFAKIPALVATAISTCADMATNIGATTPAVSDHAPGPPWVLAGNAAGALQQAGIDDSHTIADRTEHLYDIITAAMNALMAAVPAQQFPALGPFYAQFGPRQVMADLMDYARFLHGGAHTTYDQVPLDDAGHTGVQLMSRWMLNQIGQLSRR